MKFFIERITDPYVSFRKFHLVMLLFRITVSVQLMVVHGFKKIGIGVPYSESVPNPYHFPEVLNSGLVILANIICPLLIIAGAFSRLAAIPVLGVTLTGYFLVHGNDPLSIRDVPFMYSLSFLVIFVFGPGAYSLDNIVHSKA